SGATARLTWFCNDPAGPAALRTRPRDREESLLKANLSLAVALRANRWRRAGRRAGTAAGLAVFLTRNLDRRFRAARRFLERDLEVVPQVGAALRTAAAPRAAEQIAEPEDLAEAAENVAEVGEDRRIEARAGPGRRAHTAMAEA